MRTSLFVCLCIGLLELGVAAFAWPADVPAVAPRVAIQTSYGRIVAELFVKRAPITSANFLRYVDGGLYENATFYRSVRPDNDGRVPKITIIQGGIDPTCRKAPLSPIAHESTEATGLRNVNGALSVVRWEPGTAASEFFIVIGDTPELDFGGGRHPDKQGFAVFGRVVEGMDVVRRINASPTQDPADGSLRMYKGQALAEPVHFRVERLR